MPSSCACAAALLGELALALDASVLPVVATQLCEHLLAHSAKEVAPRCPPTSREHGLLSR